MPPERVCCPRQQHQLAESSGQPSMSNFDPNAILRGAQLTLVGGMECLWTIALCGILTWAQSKPRTPESRSFHVRSLPSSSACCSCGNRHPSPCVDTGTFTPRSEDLDGHEYSQEVALRLEPLSCSLDPLTRNLTSNFTSPASYINADRAFFLDCWSQDTTMDHLLVCQHGRCYLGQQCNRWAALP